MTDHSWPETLIVDAYIGFHAPARSIKIFGPDPLAVAITGQLACLSYEHGPGRKIKLGKKWLLRAREKAADVERQAEDL